MNRVGNKMQQATGVFNLPGKRPSMLALGFAPGGFVGEALKVNPNVQVVGITLPIKEKGVESLVKSPRLDLIQADVTMLAVDLEVSLDDIPSDHPDAKRFLKRAIRPRKHRSYPFPVPPLLCFVIFPIASSKDPRQVANMYQANSSTWPLARAVSFAPTRSRLIGSTVRLIA